MVSFSPSSNCVKWANDMDLKAVIRPAECDVNDMNVELENAHTDLLIHMFRLSMKKWRILSEPGMLLLTRN